MAETEKRFPGDATVHDLKKYLKKMKKKIRKKIEKEKVKDAEKANNFIRLISDVLQLPYFKTAKDESVNVLMSYLKNDSENCAKLISKLETRIREAKARIENLNQQIADLGSPIDITVEEWKERHFEFEEQLNEERKAMFLAQKDIRELKNKRKLIQRLKGMICRPKGFFAKLWS